MRTISNSEFAAHPEMYLDMAREQDVRIRRGDDTFHLTRETDDDDEKELSEEEEQNLFAAAFPDGMPALLSDEEEIARAITVDEVLERVHRNIDRKWAERRL